MTSLNIGGDKADASYRYKMPPLVTKIEGRGNGIKTVILNMTDIAKSLHIHPAYPTKYFGIEVGAQSKYSASSDRAVVNGAHQQPDLAKILERFIQTFILCPRCKLPELKMSVKSSIKIDCAACGNNQVLKSTHKLCQYIIKNPPQTLDPKKGAKARPTGEDDEEGEGDDEKIEKKGGKKEHKKDKKKKSKTADDDGDDDGDATAEADGDDITAPAVTEANGEAEEDIEEESPKEKPKKSKSKDKEKSSKSKSSSLPNDDEDDVWFTDTSKEAQAARKEAEFAEAREAAAAASNIEKIRISDIKGETPATTMKMFLASGSPTNAQIVAELKRIALAKGLDQQAKVRCLIEGLFDTASPKDVRSVTAFFHSRAGLLTSFASDRINALSLIACIEELFGVTHREFINAVPHALKQLYDDDVLDEEAIIAWFDSPPESSWLVKKDVAEAVRAKAKQFVEWLKEAEEDGDDEDDEEEEEDDD